MLAIAKESIRDERFARLMNWCSSLILYNMTHIYI